LSTLRLALVQINTLVGEFDYNLRRLERYMAIAWESGAEPVVILTKADLCADIQAKTAEVAA
jgi:ribosome biogenesis GTPase